MRRKAAVSLGVRCHRISMSGGVKQETLPSPASKLPTTLTAKAPAAPALNSLATRCQIARGGHQVKKAPAVEGRGTVRRGLRAFGKQSLRKLSTRRIGFMSNARKRPPVRETPLLRWLPTKGADVGAQMPPDASLPVHRNGGHDQIENRGQARSDMVASSPHRCLDPTPDARQISLKR